MRKIIITCLLLMSISFVASAQTYHDLTPTELAVSLTTATNTTNTLNTSLGFTTVQYNDVKDIEFIYQKQYDWYIVNGLTPCVGQLANITIQRDQRLQQALTPAQYAIYLTLSH